MIGTRMAGCAAACMAPGRPERSAARDAALDRVAAAAGQSGWTIATLRDVAGPDADLLFPGGAVDLVEAWFDRSDRDMIEVAHDLDEPRLSRRVRAVILLRLETIAPDRAAVRRALGVLLTPGNGHVLARTLARSVDAIWEAAGDRAEGVAWYTKRVTLAAIYVQVLLFWLARGDDMAAVTAFLDRRLARVARFGRMKHRLLSGRAA
ncbi:COQ9 family protein [Gluconacetobacter tumulisoli]|uniref:COQ9 family protein n=1 Tax=Gluconacetobacter tumulisoli TaxID=1286189 RepID=A0A7W4K9N1_9PROT|nr:COQ9 family protein [Gluconacetobacter tumulisoli]MBB2202888.1 COQ9 family protein [Gluconacetobacter tumulisoli]